MTQRPTGNATAVASHSRGQTSGDLPQHRIQKKETDCQRRRVRTGLSAGTNHGHWLLRETEKSRSQRSEQSADH